MDKALHNFFDALQSGKPPHLAMQSLYEELEAYVADAYAVPIQKMACKAGCSFCCNLTVEATPVEVFAILTYVQKTFTTEQVASLKTALMAHSEKVASRPMKKLLFENRPCPFLRDGLCSVYEVRPIGCRRHHSARVSDCEKSAADPSYDVRQYSMSDSIHLHTRRHGTHFGTR
jgi:Fe-S-cluster containining protein